MPMPIDQYQRASPTSSSLDLPFTFGKAFSFVCHRLSCPSSNGTSSTSAIAADSDDMDLSEAIQAALAAARETKEVMNYNLCPHSVC